MLEKPPTPEEMNKLHEEALELDKKMSEPFKTEHVSSAQEIDDKTVLEKDSENNEGQAIYQSEKELQKTAQEILDKSIAGKTRAELTQEQKEAEDLFCQKNLEKLVDLIDEEKVMLHLTSGKLSDILEKGLFSRHEIYYKNKLKDREHIRKEKWSFQSENFEFLRDQIVKPYVVAYRGYLDGKLTKDELDKIKDDLLNIKVNVGKGGVQNIPKIGRKRVLFFMKKTIPEFVKKGIEFSSDDINFESALSQAEESKYHEHVFKTNKEENIEKQRKDADLWQQLINVMGGNDLISANPSAYLKYEFADGGPSSVHEIRPLAHFEKGLEVFFDTPPEIRLYDLGGGRGIEDIKNSEDVAVSNRITPNHFKAIRFGVFDKEKRILYVTDQIDEHDIDILSDKQKNSLLLFDTCTIPIPPIKSVKLSKYEDFDYYDGPKTVEQKSVHEVRKNNSDNITYMLWDLIAEKGFSWGKRLDDMIRVHWRPMMERKRKKNE